MATHTTTARPTAGKINLLMYGIGTALLLLIAWLVYRNWQLSQEFDRRRTALYATARQNQVANDRQQLTFGMKTFVWAIRNAMLQNKPGEINEYFNTLVKDRGVREMLLVDSAGKVLISTNKKNQGIGFSSRFPVDLLQQQDVFFNDKRPYELSAPVTAPNKRLGTLVMFYTPAPILPPADSLR